MAQAKLIWLLDFIGLPVYFLGIWANIDNIKSLILFLIGVVYAGMRIYYYYVDRDLAKREKEIDIWNKEQDKIDRINKTKIN